MVRADERMIEIVPQPGAFVTCIRASALDDGQFVRQGLDCATISGAAELAGDDDVAALRAIVGPQAPTRVVEEFERVYVLDDAFHGSLYAIADHGVAWTTSERVSGHLNRSRRLSLPLPSYIADTIEQHTVVADAIEPHDPDAAQVVLRSHLVIVLTGLPEVERPHPDYFESDLDRAWARAVSRSR